MRGYTYDEAVEIEDFTRKEVQREIARHDAESGYKVNERGEMWRLFLAEVGDKDEYTGSEVLEWLGY